MRGQDQGTDSQIWEDGKQWGDWGLIWREGDLQGDWVFGSPWEFLRGQDNGGNEQMWAGETWDQWVAE